MTVIQLGNVGFPRGEEIVTTPQILLQSSYRDRAHTNYPLYTVPNIGDNSADRASYDTWKKEHGIAGLTIGNTTISNTQIVVTLVGAIIGYLAGKKFLTDNKAYMTSLIGGILAFLIVKNYKK